MLEIEATRPASTSTLARVTQMIEEAQASRAPAQAFVDRFAAVYTPVVVGLALVLAVGGSVATGDPRHWVMLALVLLVVACPCALVISTPVALVAAIGSAARRGVLFKGGSALESLAAVRTVAFDKTGTLTHGRPTVRDVIPLDGLAADEILARAAAVEQGRSHPIARGILAAAGERGLAIPAAAATTSRTGSAPRPWSTGVPVAVGSARLVPVESDATRAVVARLDDAGDRAGAGRAWTAGPAA